MDSEKHKHDILSRWYEGPAPKKKGLPRRVTGYRVAYGGSAKQDSRLSRRVYTKETAEKIATRLERLGIQAYIAPTLTTQPIYRKRKSRHASTR